VSGYKRPREVRVQFALRRTGLLPLGKLDESGAEIAGPFAGADLVLDLPQRFVQVFRTK
jgi:hypothetical protein